MSSKDEVLFFITTTRIVVFDPTPQTQGGAVSVSVIRSKQEVDRLSLFFSDQKGLNLPCDSKQTAMQKLSRFYMGWSKRHRVNWVDGTSGIHWASLRDMYTSCEGDGLTDIGTACVFLYDEFEWTDTYEVRRRV